MARRAARIDSNHVDIVRTLRDVGNSACSLASVGHGVPDLLVGANGLTLVGRFNTDEVRRVLAVIDDLVIHDGANLLLEIKDGAKAVSKQALTPDEQRWHREWQGQLAICRSEDEALQLVGIVLATEAEGG